MTHDASLVQRLISFLKKPNALAYENEVKNPYDDYEPREKAQVAQESVQTSARGDTPLMGGRTRSPHTASRLDAMMMRTVQQFTARAAYVIRYDSHQDQMHYLTGRDNAGRYVDHQQAKPDHRALFLALDSGESQLFVHHEDSGPVPILCGPLWTDRDEVIGILYLDNPARSSLHRGVFDVYCDQVARLLASGAE